MSNYRQRRTTYGILGQKKGNALSFGIWLLVFSVLAFWLFGHQMVKRRFAKLKAELAERYDRSISVPPHEEAEQSLMALCVDLMRRETCEVPFDQLTSQEKSMVLHACAVEMLPAWMTRYASYRLSRDGRVLIGKLRDIKSSRPNRPQQHFGAIKRQQQLRSGPQS
jgi:hypothetical protein